MARGSINVAVIGLGHVAEYHLAAIQKVDDFTLIGASDQDTEKQSKIANTIPFFSDHSELLKLDHLNSVVVATPVDSHFAIAKAALVHGKNVLLEKPAASNMQELQELIRIASDQTVILVIAFHAAFAKDVLWFRDQYCRHLWQELGPLTAFCSRFSDPYVHGENLDGRARSLVGSWLDSGINALSVIGEFVKPQKIKVTQASFTRLSQTGCSDIQAKVDFSFSINEIESAGTGIIETSWALGKDKKSTQLYFGRSGVEITLDHSDQQVRMRDTYGRVSNLADFSGTGSRLLNHYLGVFADFRNRLISSSDNLHYGKKVHQLLFSAMAAQEGRFLGWHSQRD